MTPEERRAYNKVYRERNREKLRACNAAYRKRNREKLKAANRAWNERNKEHRRAYYERNNEEILAYAKAYRERNKEKIQAYQKVYGPAYRQRTREKKRAYNRAYEIANREWHLENKKEKEARRRARKLGGVGRVLFRDWDRLVNRHDSRCAYCRTEPATEQDHVVPLSRGGRHTIGNVLPACIRCNRGKHARLLIEWADRPRRAAS